MGDLAGNQRVYAASALAAKSWPSKLTVQAGDHRHPDTSTGRRSWDRRRTSC